ncbi:HAD hydrolase-like protein [bacterium]|nr:HAD hydrolase-like protein [bacterium]
MEQRAVIFDLLGTLVDNFRTEDYRQTLARMAQELEVDPERFRLAWKTGTKARMRGEPYGTGAGIEMTLNSMGCTAGPDTLARATEIRMQLSRELLLTRPESVPLLESLRQRGIRTALISDCSSEIPELWPESPFAALIEHAEYSCVAGCTKPDRRLWDYCLAALRLEASDCLYIGDGGGSELSTAMQLGMQAIQIVHVKEASGGFMGQDRELAACPQAGSIELLTRQLS